MKLPSRRWLSLALVPLLGCAAITTDAFDEAVDGAVADAGTDTAHDGGLPQQDSSEPPLDTALPDTGVFPTDTSVGPDTRPDTTPPPVDSPVGGEGVQCGASPTTGTTCTTGQRCCITTATSGRSYACQSLTSPTGCTGIDLACDNTSDCASTAGAVCCGSLNMAGMGTTSLVTGSTCVAASQCTTANNRIILCSPTQPNVCPTGKTCRQSTGTLPGYYLCL